VSPAHAAVPPCLRVAVSSCLLSSVAVPVVREHDDGLSGRGLHAQWRLLERGGQDGANPEREQLLNTLLVTSEETERGDGGLPRNIGAILEQPNERPDAGVLDDVLGEVRAIAGERDKHGSSSPHGERTRLQPHDVVQDQAEHRLVLGDVGHPPQVTVVIDVGGDRVECEEAAHVGVALEAVLKCSVQSDSA
jgi:hypothetical protein